MVYGLYIYIYAYFFIKSLFNPQDAHDVTFVNVALLHYYYFVPRGIIGIKLVYT